MTAVHVQGIIIHVCICMWISLIHVCHTLISEICAHLSCSGWSGSPYNVIHALAFNYDYITLCSCVQVIFSVFTIMCFSTARERIIGWYHSGPKLHHNDIAIHELIGKYCQNPVSQYCVLFSVKVGS